MEWISINDKKPQTRQKVLVCFTNEYKQTLLTIAEYIGEKEVLAEDDLSPDCDDFCEYDEEKDCYWTPAGWYEWQYVADINYFLDEQVNYWMPLPAAKV